MKKSQKKKLKSVNMHQHIDEHGRVFGSLHPEDAEHNNTKTKKFHDLTIQNKSI